MRIGEETWALCRKDTGDVLEQGQSIFMGYSTPLSADDCRMLEKWCCVPSGSASSTRVILLRADDVAKVREALKRAKDELEDYAADDVMADLDGGCGARTNPRESIKPTTGAIDAALALLPGEEASDG